jgi:hypothetical protein
LQVDEVLFEGLAVTLETMPPFKRRLTRSGFGRLATAGQLGPGLGPFFTDSGGLGRPTLVPGMVSFQGCLLRCEEVGE